ncbi:MAG: hypothetical protein AAFY15_08750 [Cyanobacteria bacterium J06648_11]
MLKLANTLRMRFLQAVRNALSSRASRDFTSDRCGVDYVFELDADSHSGYITSSGSKVRVGDRLTLPDGDRLRDYKVVAVDYYCNPSDMWIARVERVPESAKCYKN